MPKLISAHFVKNEAHCIQKMLTSLQPHVEQTYVMIDDTTSDNTQEICEANGCITKPFKFENFGKTWNTLLKWVNDKGDWGIFIAPDETISEQFGKDINKIINTHHTSNIDGVWFPRRHWEDLDMKKEYSAQQWYPDWQLRLIRLDYPRLYMQNYVHEWPAGLRQTIRHEVDIHHFNVYYKPLIEYDFKQMNELYESLKQQQQKDGGINIWPEEQV